MKAKEFIKSEMYKDSHLKGHIEQMDAIKQMLVIELLEKYAEYKAKNLPIHNVSDWLDEDSTDCGCDPETCKMLKGKCKNLAYR